MSNLTDKQKMVLDRVEGEANKVLAACKDLKTGKITGEEFEKRISKSYFDRAVSSLS